MATATTFFMTISPDQACACFGGLKAWGWKIFMAIMMTKKKTFLMDMKMVI